MLSIVLHLENNNYFPKFKLSFQQALYENLLVEVPLAGFFVSKILGRSSSSVEFHHLDSLDPELCRNLLYLKTYEGDVQDLGLDFTVLNSDLGQNTVSWSLYFWNFIRKCPKHFFMFFKECMEWYFITPLCIIQWFYISVTWSLICDFALLCTWSLLCCMLVTDFIDAAILFSTDWRINPKWFKCGSDQWKQNWIHIPDGRLQTQQTNSKTNTSIQERYILL